MVISKCCGDCVATVYSSSPSIIVGTQFYSNSGLTTPFTPNLPSCDVYRTGTCLPVEDGSYSFDGFTVNGSGVVTSIDQLVNCQ